MDVADWVSIVVSVVTLAVGLAGAFYFKGRVETQIETMKEAQEKQAGQIEDHGIALHDQALKAAKVESTLESIDKRTERIERLLESLAGRPH